MWSGSERGASEGSRDCRADSGQRERGHQRRDKGRARPTSRRWSRPSALTKSRRRADKLTNLADKIFEDSRERAQALVHEAPQGDQTAKQSPLSDSVRDIKAMTDLMMMVKSVTEDKDDGGSKR